MFTLPAELRRIVRAHQRPLLGVLCRAAFDSLAALCADPRWLGGQIGALAVLHTWTRTLECHPHVHLLVPAGGLAPDGRTWLEPPSRQQPFLVPVRALSELFRGRFLHLARRPLPAVPWPDVPWSKRWVVFAKPVARAKVVLEYLGRYVHRTALSDKAITACDEHSVSFTYKDSHDGRRKSMTLPAHEFLRRFLQHVPLRGLHRVRAFGLLHPAQRATLRRLRLLLTPDRSRETAVDGDDAAVCGPRCPRCSEPALRRIRRLSAPDCSALSILLPPRPSASFSARAPPADGARPQ